MILQSTSPWIHKISGFRCRSKNTLIFFRNSPRWYASYSTSIWPVSPDSIGVSVQIAAVQPQEVRTVWSKIGWASMFLNRKTKVFGCSCRKCWKSWSRSVNHSTTGDFAGVKVVKSSKKTAGAVIEEEAKYRFKKSQSIISKKICDRNTQPRRFSACLTRYAMLDCGTKSRKIWYHSKTKISVLCATYLFSWF